MIQFAQPKIPDGLMRDMIDLETQADFKQGQGGQWAPGEKKSKTFKGTLAPISKGLQYSIAGTFTLNSQILYTNGHKLYAGAQFRDTLDNATYTVKEVLDHTPIHGVKRYIVERKGGSRPK